MLSTASHTGAPSSRPGSRTANSTRSCEPGTTATFSSYCEFVSDSDKIARSRASPQMPRVFTPESTRFRSPTPSASLRISPTPLYTFSSCPFTSRNDSPSRASSVRCMPAPIASSFCSF